MKTKLKFITALTISVFLLVVISIGAVPAKANDSDPIKIKIMAKGINFWPPSTEVSIIAEIRMGDPNVAEVEFHHKRYDEAGKKVWSLKGKLSNGAVEEWDLWEDPNTGMTFINLWYVGGVGKAKYKNGQYFEAYIGMLVSPYGVYIGGTTGIGWAWAAIFIAYNPTPPPDIFWDGHSTNLVMYKEIVP